MADMNSAAADMNNSVQKNEEMPSNYSLNSQPKPDINKLRDDMINGMGTLDAEWIKRDAIKNMSSADSNNPMLPGLQKMPAEEFKTQMLKGIREVPDEQFIVMLQQDNILDSEGYFTQDLKDKQKSAKENHGDPKYGFEPRQQLNLDELKKRLTSEQFHTTQFSIPEKEMTGKYVDHFEEGKYTCVGCYTDLFSSKHKYKSTKGFAAFHDKIGDIHEMGFAGVVTEAKCENCGSYLGDVVKNDEGVTTDKSYFINSNSIDFTGGKFID